MRNLAAVTSFQQNRALGLSTVAFTACFAVWAIFSIIGIQIKQSLGLSETALPIAFDMLNDLTGIWQSCFMMLLGLVDMLLLASTLMTPGVELWTLDKRLCALAERFGVMHRPTLH